MSKVQATIIHTDDEVVVVKNVRTTETDSESYAILTEGSITYAIPKVNVKRIIVGPQPDDE